MSVKVDSHFHEYQKWKLEAAERQDSLPNYEVEKGATYSGRASIQSVPSFIVPAERRAQVW